MRFLNASELAREIMKQKIRYWQNTLSSQAIETNLFNTFDLMDHFRLVYDLTIFDSVFSSLLFAINFGIEFKDMPIFNLCYDVELPTPEEFALGKLLHIDSVSCLNKYPEIGGFLVDLYSFTEQHFSEDIAKTTPVKARYGVSRYGEAYIDPAPFYEAFRSTLLKEAKVFRSGAGVRAIYKAFAESLEVNRDLVDYIYTLQTSIERSKLFHPVADYAWADKTSMETEATAVGENLDGEQLEFEAVSLDDQWGGAVADIAIADLSFTADEPAPEVGEVPHESKHALIAIADIVAREQRERLASMPLLIANYQTDEERENFAKSYRAGVYSNSRIIYYKLKEAVEKEARDLPMFDQNQYQVAVQQLYSRLTRDGGWGHEAYRAMSIDELKKEWVEEWSLKGLDRNILDRLFDKAIKVIEIYAPLRIANKITLRARYRR